MYHKYLIILLLFLSCHSSTEKNNKKVIDTPHVVQSGTQKMIKRLSELYENFNPQEVSFLNSARAAYFKSQTDVATDNNKKFEMYYMYCRELINAGKSKEGIVAIEELLRSTGNNIENINDMNRPFYDLLAIGYMRLGEQENCIVNHTGVSCILPLQAKGLHQLKTGSSKAIEIYTRLLEKYNDDFNSGWLLNLAYMTLGDYPKKVPAKWRLPPAAFSSHGIIPRFENIATELGVDRDGHAGGCCVEDFNNDGHLDIMASSWGLKDQIRLFINDGNGSFTDKTSEAGLDGITGGLNIVHADYNNDGYADVLVLRGAWLMKEGNHPNSLLRNNGNAMFEDVTEQAGIYSEHPTQTAAWADFNLDGFLDLFIGNESGKTYFNPCEMFVNNGNGTFTESAGKLGLNFTTFVKGCSWGDVDNNGLSDLYVSVFGGDNKLFLNYGGTTIDNWKFEESAARAGVQQPYWSFPTWFFDYDNDGYDDIFVCGYDFPRFNKVAEDELISILNYKPIAELPRLYHNNGNGTFTDVTKKAGVSRVMYGMGSNFEDINNDGWLDFYIGTGVPDLRSIIPNRMFLNQNGKSFVDVTYDGGFGHIQKGHGVGFGDLDNDGDQDIYCVIGGAYEGDNFRSALFHNPGNKNNWIILQLTGKTANRSAIGTRIKLTVSNDGKSRSIYRNVSTGGSFGSSSLQVEIGLEHASVINSIEVTWANKQHSVQTFTNVKPNKKYLLTEGEQLTTVKYNPVQWQLKKVDHHHHH